MTIGVKTLYYRKEQFRIVLLQLLIINLDEVFNDQIDISQTKQ